MTSPLTILWKFPGMRESHVWRIVRADGGLAFLTSEDGLSVAAVDVEIGVVTLSINDSEGARVRAFEAKENLCNLVESMIGQFIASGGTGDGGVPGDRR